MQKYTKENWYMTGGLAVLNAKQPFTVKLVESFHVEKIEEIITYV